MNLDPAAPDLFSIPLDQDFPGFTGFIHAWLYTNGPVFLVDPGPTATIGRLAKALEALSARPDFILLTHVHLDHSGGVGNLLRLLGPIPVIAHPKAAPHLANPSRLWEGSVETLGDMARAYGPPRAVDPGLVRDAFQASVPGLAVIPT
ncbi:MAG: MBL fold metallo-hydrolase, partial [Pseudomonadota bacterium]